MKAGAIKGFTDKFTGGSGNTGEAVRQGLLWTGRAAAKRTVARVTALEKNQTALQERAQDLAGVANNPAVEQLSKMDKAQLVNPLNVKNVTVTQISAGDSKKDILYAQRMTNKNTKLLEQFTKATQDIADNTKEITKQDTKIKKKQNAQKNINGKAAAPGKGLASAEKVQPKDTDSTMKTMLKTWLFTSGATMLGGLLATATGAKLLAKSVGKVLKVRERVKNIRKIKEAKSKLEKKLARKEKIKAKVKSISKKVDKKLSLSKHIKTFQASKAGKAASKIGAGAKGVKAAVVGIMNKIGKGGVLKILKKVLTRVALAAMGPVGFTLAAAYTMSELYDFIKWGLINLGVEESYITEIEDAIIAKGKALVKDAAINVGLVQTEETRRQGHKVFKSQRKSQDMGIRIDKSIKHLLTLLEVKNPNKDNLRKIYVEREHLLKLHYKYMQLNNGKNYGDTLRTYLGWDNEVFYNEQILLAQTQETKIRAEQNAQLLDVKRITERVGTGGIRSSGGSSGKFTVSGDSNLTLAKGSTIPAEPNATGLNKQNLGRLMNALGQRESANDYTAVNTLGFLGRWQFGAAALEDLGVIKKGASKNGSNKQVLGNPTNWVVPFSREHFLQSTEQQDIVMENWLNLMAKRLGSKRGKEQGDISGMLAAAHLGGVKNAKKLKTSGADFKDAYGTSIKEYYNLGANASLGIMTKPGVAKVTTSQPRVGLGNTSPSPSSKNARSSSIPVVNINNANYEFSGDISPGMDPNTVFVRSGSAATNDGWNGLEKNFKVRVLMLGIDFLTATGEKMKLNSAYRSVAYQTKLYNEAKDKSMVAKPGRSYHNFGRAVDIDMRGNQANRAVQMGLLKKHKLWRPMTKEPWHIEPIETKKNRGRTNKNVIIAETSYDVAKKPPAGAETGNKNYDVMSHQSVSSNPLANQANPAKKQEAVNTTLAKSNLQAIDTARAAMVAAQNVQLPKPAVDEKTFDKLTIINLEQG